MGKKKIWILLAVILVLVAAVVVWIVQRNIKEGREIDSIALSITPVNTEFSVGDTADFIGLQIYVRQKNGNGYSVNHEACTYSGFDSSVPVENQVITVMYEGFTTTFTVTIKEPPTSAPVLTELVMKKLPKTEYKVGDDLDAIGGIATRIYSDGSTKPLSLINRYVVKDYDMTRTGTQTITVRYIEDGALVEATYQITITE